MKRRRKAVSLEQKLAAALACLLPQDQRDELRRTRAPAKAVIKLFTMHHLDYWTFSEDDHWSNLDPMLRAPHEERFAKDAAAIAKVKRLQRQFRPEVIGGMARLPGWALPNQGPKPRSRPDRSQSDSGPCDGGTCHARRPERPELPRAVAVGYV
jgi:hypothetical protein